MRAEFHKRLVNVLTPLLLPFLAVPFAIGRRRSQRAYRFGLALVLLVAFHEVDRTGKPLRTRTTGALALAHHVAAVRPAHFVRSLALPRHCLHAETGPPRAGIDRFGDAVTAPRRVWFMRATGMAA